MEETAAALLGALVGGFVTLGATLFVELRRDRRRQLSSARMVSAEFWRASIELMGLTDSEETWIEGPHPALAPLTWRQDAAYFVGILSPEDFKKVDDLARHLQQAGEWGFTKQEGERLLSTTEEVEGIVEPLTRVRWLDRRLWRL